MTARKRGRPTMYDPQKHPATVEALSEKGATLADIAARLKIARSTLHLWVDEHPEFSDAITRGREGATDQVERSLFERAIGYSYKEERLFVVAQGHGQASKVERHTVQVRMPPDVSAAKFWLTNRRRDRWCDKQKVEHSGTLTLEQLLAASQRRPEGDPSNSSEGG